MFGPETFVERVGDDALAQAADTLLDLEFRGLRATGLRRKHVVALVREWKRQGRSIGTMKNRAAHVRCWAKRVGRPGVVRANGELGIANREYVTNEDRSAILDPEKPARVKDPHVAMAVLAGCAAWCTCTGRRFPAQRVLCICCPRGGFPAFRAVWEEWSVGARARTLGTVRAERSPGSRVGDQHAPPSRTGS